MSRPVATIVAELTGILQAASVSSQLDPAAVTSFAALATEAVATLDAVQRAADADTVADTVSKAAALADDVSTMQANVAGALTMLQGIRREAADAAAQLEAVRAELAAIRGDLPGAAT